MARALLDNRSVRSTVQVETMTETLEPVDVATSARNVCVVVADAARGRVLLLDDAAGGVELVEVARITNPALRVRGGGLGAVQRHDADRHFAAEIAEEAAAACRLYPRCELVVVAAPGMLALLRVALERAIGTDEPITLRLNADDLTRLAGAPLHDALAQRSLVPARAGVTRSKSIRIPAIAARRPA
jgi:hypothetical protein